MRTLIGIVTGISILAILLFMHTRALTSTSPITVINGAPGVATDGSQGRDPQSRDKDWAAMMARAGTVQLVSYEHLAEPIDQRMALVQAMYRCDIRDLPWQESMTAKLEEARDIATVSTVEHMSESELQQTAQFNATVIRGETADVLNDQLGLKGCRELAKKPFVGSDAVLQDTTTPLPVGG